MAKTGPQRYPGASTTYWYGTKYPGSAMESNVVVWHTTEGTSLPGYSGGAEAPNFTAVPDFKEKKLRWYQHFDFDVSSRALVNKSGGVQTNTLNVVQVEIVGTCDPNTHKKWGSTPHLYSADLPDWAVRDLAVFAKWANANHGVPLTGRTEWLAYGKDSRRPGVTPASYGASPARMTFNEWNNFKGHCGHQHVPENDHGDPGVFPMAAILNAARTGTVTTEEDPLAGITKQDIWDAVWRTDAVPAPKTSTTIKTNPTWAAVSVLQDIANRVRSTETTVTAQAATIKTLVQALADRDDAVDVDALVQRITDAIESVTVRLDVDPKN